MTHVFERMTYNKTRLIGIKSRESKEKNLLHHDKNHSVDFECSFIAFEYSFKGYEYSFRALERIFKAHGTIFFHDNANFYSCISKLLFTVRATFCLMIDVSSS